MTTSYQDFGLIISQTQAASVDSAPMDMSKNSGFSIQTEWSDGLTGSFVVQSRNSESLQWRDITQITLTSPAGSGGGEVFEVGNCRSKFYRVRFFYTSGTSTLSVAVHAKGGM
jgi:hypothetical protein